MASVPLAALPYTFTSFLNDYPVVLSREGLSQEVPYVGGEAEVNFYVEGLRFPDKDFNGLISINLSVLEPISEVRVFNSSHHGTIMLSIVPRVGENIWLHYKTKNKGCE